MDGLQENKKFFPNSAGAFSEFIKSVEGGKFAVVGHMRPDGDCIGSQVAMAYLLRKLGAQEVVCLNKNEVPFLYREFTCGEKFLSTEDFCDASFEIITVDCADLKRTSDELGRKFPVPFACFDHHVSNKPYAKLNIIEPSASATAELLAGLMADAGIEFDSEIASSLFMALMMDTRQLTTSNTNLRAFEIATLLVAKGADPADISVKLYQREKFGRMKLLAQFLQSLTMHYGGKVCIGLLKSGVYEKTGSSKEDSDGLVDYARNIDGVEIAVLLEDLADGGVKGSLRSKRPEMQVNEIAARFGGGGHFAAAGFNVKMSMDEFYPELLNIIGEHLKR
ncbi:MAG: DHH family phosphoesterase [Opitutales bacterium]|nr:DHH family phosphoesterase [Opitutales bacterium]